MSEPRYCFYFGGGGPIRTEGLGADLYLEYINLLI